jgi:hypothetical protein
VDPDLFFPPVEVGPLCAEQIAQAKAVCARCPVRPECLRWALDGLPHGIAGGLTSEERGELRARDRRRRPPQRRAGCPVRGSQAEQAAAGRTAIRDGLQVQAVAREFGVSVRTAQRWAALVRPAGVSGGGR